MKLLKKLVIAAIVANLTSGAFAFNVEQFTTSIDDFNKTVEVVDSGLDDFAESLALAVPQAATQQNVWADAYIGKVFPSIPPHFGGGFNVGLTHLDTSGLAKAAKVFEIKNIKDSYYLPVFTADLRVGGVLLPFDVDIAVMKTGTFSTGAMGCDLDFDFFTIGADFRYALLEGGLILPKVSVGAGYFYNQGSFGAGNDNAEMNIDYKVHTMYLQAQVSKSFFIATPFLGLRGLVSKCDNTYDWKLKGSVYDEVSKYVDSIGVKTSGSGSYKTDSFDFGAIQPQVYAGVGLNFLVFQTTLSLSADLRNIGDKGLWSGAFSFRAKL